MVGKVLYHFRFHFHIFYEAGNETIFDRENGNVVIRSETNSKFSETSFGKPIIITSAFIPKGVALWKSTNLKKKITELKNT